MQSFLLDRLVCPICHGGLRWTIAEALGDRIETAEAFCATCPASYPVKEGIALFLTPGLARHDLWEELDSQLSSHLRQHPDVERRLMDVPLDTLAPADLFFRSLMLEEREDYVQAAAVMRLASSGLYTREYLACADNMIRVVMDRLAGLEWPVMDLASGRGRLVEEMLRGLEIPVAATDFSPRVLRRARGRLRSLGLHDRVSLLSFDARRTPFGDGAVRTMTSYLGLSNIEESGTLLRELRRIVSGMLIAVAQFFPEDDEPNRALILQAGLQSMLYRRLALAAFAEVGFDVEVAAECTSDACPTPASVVLEGAGIDALPVAETSLEWCVLVAH